MMDETLRMRVYVKTQDYLKPSAPIPFQFDEEEFPTIREENNRKETISSPRHTRGYELETFSLEKTWTTYLLKLISCLYPAGSSIGLMSRLLRSTKKKECCPDPIFLGSR